MNTALNKFKKYRRRPDYVILLMVVGLALFGLVMIGSASALVAFERFDGANNYFYVGRQAISLVVGLVLMVITMSIDYRVWRKYAIWMLIITLVVLVIAIIPGLGSELKGASRWVDIGPFRFQPSEIAKLTFILYLASWLEKRINKVNIIPLLLILGVVATLIILQPDLGTLSVIVAIAAAMFFAAGGSYVQIAAGAAVIVVAFWIFIRSSAYRWQRFLTFINPSTDTLDTGYHINQSLLAVGSGGLLGLGFGQSVQKYLYLPEPFSDSIFAIIAEELGFLRASLVIVAFALIAWRGFRIARYAPDNFGRLIAVGVTTWIIFQAFVNIAALTGIVPLTGVTLPFISYGGSSLIATLAAIGILLNISKNCNYESKSKNKE